MNCNIRRDVRVCFTKLRLSSINFLAERARWLKVKGPYTQRPIENTSGMLEIIFEVIVLSETNMMNFLFNDQC